MTADGPPERPSAGLAARAAAGWNGFWSRLEGPELDAPPWHSHYLTSRLIPPVMRRLGGHLQGRVLDIGAGTGYARRFLDPSTTYVPTDLPSGRDAEDPSIAARGERPRVLCSGYDLPFREGSFEGATVLMVLEHAERPDRILAEAFRVLAPGGRLMVSVPFAFPVHGFPHDFRRWTAAGLGVELERAGFRVVETASIGGFVATLVLNWGFSVRFHAAARPRHRAVPHLVSAIAPLRLLGQLVANGVALALGPLDRSEALPLAVAAVGEKPAAAD
ncbi:MAG: methyltransferase type 11 [Gemmatimonadetes bacterium]|nr:methyltransferase type 11 [Gemmatimonadota bacterium]